MSLRILILGIISLVLQSCGSYSNFNVQKYTKLKFKKNIACNYDDLLDQKDSIRITTEIEINADSNSYKVYEMTTYNHIDNPHDCIDNQSIEIKIMEQNQVINSSISVFKHAQIKSSKMRFYKKGRKLTGWLFYLLGIGLILSGIVAPLFATFIGWWIILIAFATIFIGALIAIVGADKIRFSSEEWSWSPIFAFIIGIISFGITCMVSIVLHFI